MPEQDLVTLDKQATPAPWEWHEAREEYDSELFQGSHIGRGVNDRTALLGGDYGAGAGFANPADGELVAYLRNHVREFVALQEVARLAASILEFPPLPGDPKTWNVRDLPYAVAWLKLQVALVELGVVK